MWRNLASVWTRSKLSAAVNFSAHCCVLSVTANLSPRREREREVVWAEVELCLVADAAGGLGFTVLPLARGVCIMTCSRSLFVLQPLTGKGTTKHEKHQTITVLGSDTVLTAMKIICGVLVGRLCAFRLRSSWGIRYFVVLIPSVCLLVG